METEKKVSHTPGPWTFMDEPDGIADAIVEYSGCPIATVRGTDDMACLDVEENTEKDIEAELIANAKLIAAAPELLESLKWLIKQIPELKGEISLIGMQKCYDAITKATE